MSATSKRAAAIRRASKESLKKLRELDAEGLKELELIYQQANNDLTQRIASLSDTGYYTLLSLQSVIDNINTVLASIRIAQEELISQAIQTASNIGIQPATTIGSLKYVVAYYASKTVKAVIDTPDKNGLVLSDKLWRVEAGAAKKMASEVSIAIARGDHAMKAARELLAQGKKSPLGIQADINHASQANLQRITADKLLTGEGSALSNMQRVFRTEIARANSLSYIDSHDDLEGVAGYKFNLSPNHPKKDICDMHAGVNLYGLGRGVYPKNVISRIFPAHPNTFSYITVVFKDEVSKEDKQRDKNRIEWLKTQPKTTQQGILGKKKTDYLAQGKLSDRSINTPLRVLKKRFESSGI